MEIFCGAMLEMYFSDQSLSNLLLLCSMFLQLLLPSTRMLHIKQFFYVIQQKLILYLESLLQTDYYVLVKYISYMLSHDDKKISWHFDIKNICLSLVQFVQKSWLKTTVVCIISILFWQNFKISRGFCDFSLISNSHQT